MIKKITIIGVGNGAFAVAADLTLRGYEITLYADEKHKRHINELLKTKIITLISSTKTGEANLYKVTTNLKEAIDGADLIMPVLPSYALKGFAQEIAPYLKKGDKIALAPGSTGGALIVAKTLHEIGKVDGVKIAEMHTLPYACRKTSPTSVKILLECKKLYFASFPAKYNQEMYDLVKPLYPAIELVKDVLESSLNNGNPVSHPAPVVLNAGKIEYFEEDHYHYREGITPSVARVIEKIDIERQEICKKFGYIPIDVKDRLDVMGYAPKRENLYESYRDSETFSGLKGPNDLNSRYLTEDTPCSLVALSSIADLIDVETPVMDSVITLASALKDENYWESGYTIETLGFSGMNLEEIKDFLQNGYRK